jgi:hypothetical protein
MRHKTITNKILLVCCCWILTILAGDFARADDPHGYEPANTLPWPLFNQTNNEPRQAVWSSFGEYQSYGGPKWFHSGFDIRGLYKDKIKVVAPGNVWMVANLNQCSQGPSEGNSCRLYVVSPDHRYIYYYSHLFLGPATDYTSTARAKIENASAQVMGGVSYAINPGTDVAAGDTLAYIAKFSSYSAWDHLHFGIIDANENYDMLNPFTAFADVPIDDEPPTIASLEFYQAGTPETASPVLISPSGACHVVSGNLDIVAVMEDTFFTTNPAPPDITGGATSLGIYEARYIVRRTNTAAPAIDKVWYRFDRAPLSCTGELRGNDCPTTTTESDFFLSSISYDEGAAMWGQNYASILYSDALSDSDYDTNEIYAHILTNSWGVDGSWNTTSMSNGLYQVSVEASDIAGNKASMSRFIYVHNAATPFNSNLVTPDAYVRDNNQDIGDIPSTLGGKPFWTSPDIVVLPHGAAAPPLDSDFAGNSQVQAGWDYDVYIRIHNDRCVDIDKVKAKVYSANPAMIIETSEWNTITGGNFVGDAAHPNGVTVPAGGTALLGPLSWTPTDAEADSNEGHRCMLAYINSSNDPYTTLPDVVAENDNIAQRNMQVEGATAFSIYNPEPAHAIIQLVFNCGTMPLPDERATVRLSVAYHPALASAWANIPGALLIHDKVNNILILDIRQCNITMPGVSLPAYTRLPASVKLKLPPDADGTYRVHFSEKVNGKTGGGMSFEVTGYIIK